jgi:hypothetical protein
VKLGFGGWVELPRPLLPLRMSQPGGRKRTAPTPFDAGRNPPKKPRATNKVLKPTIKKPTGKPLQPTSASDRPSASARPAYRPAYAPPTDDSGFVDENATQSIFVQDDEEDEDEDEDEEDEPAGLDKEDALDDDVNALMVEVNALSEVSSEGEDGRDDVQEEEAPSVVSYKGKAPVRVPHQPPKVRSWLLDPDLLCNVQWRACYAGGDIEKNLIREACNTELDMQLILLDQDKLFKWVDATLTSQRPKQVNAQSLTATIYDTKQPTKQRPILSVKRSPES